MKKKSSTLIIILIITVVMALIGEAIISRTVSENMAAQKNFESNRAFWLAEAGIQQALQDLRGNYALTSIAYTKLGPTGSEIGGFSVSVSGSGMNRTVVASGCVPASCSCNPASCRVIRIVDAVMNQYESIPTGFYDNAIYSAGNVTIGSNCPVNGNVFSGGTVSGTASGTITQNDPTLHTNGLPALSFAELQQISINQGWYNPYTHTTTFPTSSFYYSSGVPNVVFVDGDFTIIGGKEVVRGFVVVGGDTIYNAEIGGNASLDGCLYTRGNIWLHGGGGPNILNVNGGIWAGQTVVMDGNEQIDYNKEYMDAIRDHLHPNTDVQILTWEEQTKPYTIQ